MIPGNVIPDTDPIRGYDFNKGVDFDGIMKAMLTTGFQATALGQAIDEVNRMVRQRVCLYTGRPIACHAHMHTMHR